jgi:phosphoribosyl 1,2-cyclic phosphate phosphodiesterase
MDHVQGLFPLRWGVGDPIAVYGPPDEQGCDDLFKHPGILDFGHPVAPFVMFDLQGLRVTPLPLIHSKLTYGYLLESAHSRVAWLSDTAGLPEKTLKFLLNNQPQVIIIDCSHAPQPQTPRNHSDLNTVRALNQVIGCPRVILTHISHQFDLWMMDNPLPKGFEAGYDGMEIVLD